MVRRVPIGWALAGLVGGAGAYLYVWASRVGTWQADENQFVFLARLTDHFMPQALWNTDLFLRGIQRLEILMLAVPLALVRSPEALLIGRAVNDLAFASTAVPLFLIARGLGASRLWALLAGFLGLAVPWAVYATSFLTEPLGYALCSWTLWAVWRAATRPSARSEALAFALAFLAAVARSGFLLLLVLPLLVAVGQELRYSGLRTLPAVFWQRHRVLILVVAAGLTMLALSLAGVLFPVARLTGFYGTNFATSIVGVLGKAAQRTAPIVVGAGFIPFVFGVPWLVAQLIKPLDPRHHAFAAAGLATIVLVLYGSQSSGFDERYGMYLILPMLPAFVVTLSRRELRPLAVVAGGIFAAVLVWRHSWNGEGVAYDFFVSPAETFYARVGLMRLGPYLPGWLPVATAALVAALGVAALCASAVTRRPAARAIAAGLVAALVLVQLAQTDYALRRFVDGPGGRFGPPLSARAWVDAKIYGKARADVLADAAGNTLSYVPIWQELDFWNTSVHGVLVTGPRQIQVSLGDRFRQVTVDSATGKLVGDPELPPYFVVARSYQTLGLVGTVAASSSYLPLDLVHATAPVGARWTIAGPSPDGFMQSGGKAQLRFYSAGLRRDARWCANVPVTAPAAADGKNHRRHYVLTLGGRRLTGTVASGQTASVTLPLEGLATTPYLDATLTARGSVIPPYGGGPVSLQMGRLAVNPCASA